jgi:hypothetical protein
MSKRATPLQVARFEFTHCGCGVAVSSSIPFFPVRGDGRAARFAPEIRKSAHNIENQNQQQARKIVKNQVLGQK